MLRFRATTRLGFAFGLTVAFAFGRTFTSTCSCGIGTTMLAECEPDATPSRATAGSIATVGAARDAMARKTSGCARRDRRVCIIWNGVEDGRLRRSLGRTP